MNRLLLFSLTLMACRSPPTEGSQEGTEARVLVTTATVATSVEAPVQGMPQPPKFRLKHRFQGSVEIWAVGSALIACRDCDKRFGRPEAMPHTWLVRADGMVEDPSLLPNRQDLGKYPVRFVGHYPDPLYAIVTFGYEESGYDVAFRRMPRRGTPEFIRMQPPRHDADLRLERSKLLGEDARAFAQYVEEEQSSKPGLIVPIGPALAGHGGPLIIADHMRLARWVDSRWERTPAPWCVVRNAARLINGSSLIFSWSPADCKSKDAHSGRATGVVYWVSATGAVQQVNIREATGTDAILNVWGPIAMDKEVWIIARGSNETILLAPVNPTEVSLPDPPQATNELEP